MFFRPPFVALAVVSLLAAPPLAAQANRADSLRTAGQIDAAGKHAEARAIYQALIATAPDEAAKAAATRRLAMSYGYDANCAKVIELEQQLMQLDPQNYQHPLAVAQALMRQQRNPEALAMAKQALALAPEDQKAAIQQLVSQLGG